MTKITLNKISLMNTAQADGVALLHLKYLRTALDSSFAHKLLAAYYYSVTKSDGGCVYVATDDEKNILGYVCGIWNAGQVRKTMLRRRLIQVSFWSFLSLLSKPQMIKTYFSRTQTTHDGIPFLDQAEFVLRPIVVDTTYRNSGVAYDLVEALVAEARKRGFTSVRLGTAVSNSRANAFFKKTGFDLIEQVDREIAYNCYERIIV